MRKKIILAGATQGTNFGDSLFALMFEKRIKKCGCIPLFNKLSAYSVEVLCLDQAKLSDKVGKNILVYFSGGFFGESHSESFKSSIVRFFNYYAIGLLKVLLKEDILVIGVGVGPLNNKLNRWATKVIMNHAKIITVRDSESLDYLLKYGVTKNIIVTSDSAQAVFSSRFNFNIQKRNRNESDNKKRILVHLSGNAKYQDIYIERIVAALLSVCSGFTSFEYVLIADAIIRSEIIEDIANMFPKDKIVIGEYNEPLELISILDSVDSIITPKLHVGILGSVLGKAVLSFPIHPEKTKRYYNQIGYSNHCYSLFDTSEKEMELIMQKYLFDNVVLSNDILDKAEENFRILEEFLNNYNKSN